MNAKYPKVTESDFFPFTKQFPRHRPEFLHDVPNESDIGSSTSRAMKYIAACGEPFVS